ncbi:hypothetical protein, partial [Citrobacter braakii]|uniref:hypothetical protein n=1 Tax=Citrobacter braakii TaxID=57706 RepID=UPI001F438F4D
RRLVLNSLSAKVSWWLMMSLWDALRMNMMISYQELVRTFPKKNAEITNNISIILQQAPEYDVNKITVTSGSLWWTIECYIHKINE